MSSEKTSSSSERIALLKALGVSKEGVSRDIYAALEALAGEVLALRAERDHLTNDLEKAADLADRDALCPLFNRRAFVRELTREIASAERYQVPLSLIYIDLDNFKPVNDRFGHATGDKILQLVSTLILQNIRQTDIPARVGGDEFAILLTHAELTDATAKAKQLEAELQTLIVRDSSDPTLDPVQLGASCGTVAWKRGMTAEILLDHADERMFVAKSKRKRNKTPGEAEPNLIDS